MYTRPARRGAALGLAGAHARQVSADRHDGPYTEFLRRHEMEATQAAKGSPREHEEFARSLLPRAGDTRNVMLAIEHCASKGQAPGPNGLRPADLDGEARWDLARMLGQLIQSGEYPPSKPRTIRIDKGAGRGKRPIRIQNFEDRCVERAVLQVIRPLTEMQYLDCSLGYRCPGRTREEALATAERLAYDQNRWTWISEDLRDAFEHVPTGRLLQILRRMVPGEEVCNFIGRLTAQEGGKGIRQGGPLSPEMLNIYLHWVLDRWWRNTFPEIPMIRVADDLLILAQPDEASRLYNELAQRTMSIGMPLKGTPWSSIRDLATGQSVSWLGYEIRRRENELIASLGLKSWAKLEEHLHLAWEAPIPPLAANESIRGWIGQQGAMFRDSAVREVYSGIAQRAREQGFLEIPDREEVVSLWHKAYLRDWVRVRRKVLIRVRRRTLLADGFADQHCDSATISRRNRVARPTGVSQQQTPIRREVYLYSDGSCLGRGRGVGGWAYLLVDKETSQWQSGAGSHPRTTNNRMELFAVVRGLAALEESSRVHVVTDSQYVRDGLTDWLALWFGHDWATSGRFLRRFKNPRLWQHLVLQLETHEVDCQWVRGHSGHPENELVDTMAREAAQRPSGGTEEELTARREPDVPKCITD